MEAPIADMGTFGSMDKEGSFRNSDLNALRNPKWATKVRNMFERVPFDINVYFYNVPEGKMAPLRPLTRLGLNGEQKIDQIDVRDVEAFSAQAGAVDVEVIRPIIGKIPPNYRSAINCVLMNNEGGGRIALTPWMVGHRIVHALLFETQRFQRPSREHAQLFSTYERLVKHAEEWLKMTKGLHPEFWREDGSPMHFQTDNDRVTAVAKVLGTTKAARDGKHINAGEWLVDIITQWLVRGSVRFNRPDFCEVGVTAPHPQPEETPLFVKAREFHRNEMNGGWGGIERASDPKEFSKWLMKTHVEQPDPNSSPHRYGYGRAFDKNGNVVAEFIYRPEVIARYEARGDRVEQSATPEELLRNETKRYRAYLTKKARIEAQFQEWIDQEVLGIPGSRGSRTDKCHFHLDKFEQEFNQMIGNYMQASIGKFYVL